MKNQLPFLFLMLPILVCRAQTVIIDGSLISKDNTTTAYKDYSAELRDEDSVLIEKQKVNSAGNFTFQLSFAHDYLIAVNNKAETIWRLLVSNRMEQNQIHYPVAIEIRPLKREKDVYEIVFDKDGNKLYFKNKMPITEVTYRFETERRDSSEIIKK